MKRLRNQSGISQLTILIIVVAVLFVVTGAFIVYMLLTNRNTSTTGTSGQDVYGTAVGPSGVGTIEVKQLGFKITVPKELNDAEYSIELPDEPVFANFSSRSLVKAAEGKPFTLEDVDCSATYGPLGSIERVKEDPRDDEGYLGTEVKKSGDYYFVLTQLDGETCSGDPKAQELQEQQRAILRKAFSSLEAI